MNQRRQWPEPTLICQVKKRVAHGWRGNTTDIRDRKSTFEMAFFIRGIATLSVGLQRVRGKPQKLRFGDEYFFTPREETKRLHSREGDELHSYLSARVCVIRGSSFLYVRLTICAARQQNKSTDHGTARSKKNPIKNWPATRIMGHITMDVPDRLRICDAGVLVARWRARRLRYISRQARRLHYNKASRRSDQMRNRAECSGTMGRNANPVVGDSP